MIDEDAHRLLLAAHAHARLDVFEHAERADMIEADKRAADLLVQLRLAKYPDPGRTQLELTNAGRFWALHGGYMAFLKENPPGAGARQRDPELESIRLSYMRLRLNTFWWSFGLSIASFVISLVSLAVALFYGERLFR